MLESTLAVAVDDGVTFTYRIRNGGDESVTLSFPTSQRAEVEVFEDDELAWRWSDGRLFAQALGEEVLAPGGSFVVEVAWEDPDSGSYTAVAALASNAVDAEARAAFEV
jgi:hypothetical protein